jgi:hypothetical protein
LRVAVPSASKHLITVRFGSFPDAQDTPKTGI